MLCRASPQHFVGPGLTLKFSLSAASFEWPSHLCTIHWSPKYTDGQSQFQAQEITVSAACDGHRATTEIEPSMYILNTRSGFLRIPYTRACSLFAATSQFISCSWFLAYVQSPPPHFFSLSGVNVFTDSLLIHHLRLRQSPLCTHNPSPLLLPVSTDMHTLHPETHS